MNIPPPKTMDNLVVTPRVPSPHALLRVLPRLNMNGVRAGIAPSVPWTPGRQVTAWCDKISSHLRTWSHVELPALLVSCPSILLLVARKSHLIAGLDLPNRAPGPGMLCQCQEDMGSLFSASVVSKELLRVGSRELCCIPQRLTGSSGPERFLWSRCELSEYFLTGFKA